MSEAWKTEKWAWQVLQSLPSQISPAVARSHVQIGDKLYLFFGQTHDSSNPQCTYLRGANVVDLNTLSWEGSIPTPEDFIPRSHSSATHLKSGQGEFVLVFGGKHKDTVLNDLWALLLVGNEPRWFPSTMPANQLPPARRGHSATALADKCVFFGGMANGKYLSDMFIFDATTMNIMNVPQQSLWPEARAFHAAYQSGPHTVCIFGGQLSSISDEKASTVWQFDIRSGNWTKLLGHLQCHGRYGAGIGCWQDTQHIFVYGGISVSGQPTDVVYAFPRHSPANVTPIPVEMYTYSKPGFRAYPTVVFHRGMLYSIGGLKMENREVSNSIWVLQQKTAGVSENVVKADATGRIAEKSTTVATPATKKIDRVHPELKRTSAFSGVYSNPIAEAILQTLLLNENWEVAWKVPTSREFAIGANAVIQLCDIVKPIFAAENQIIPVRAPVKIFGDIHGQYPDLLTFFKTYGYPMHQRGDIILTNYLFLGDFVDRGSFSLEVVCVLFALKVLYPTRVFLVVGDHEFKKINRDYGFAQECAERLGPEMGDVVWNKINEVFQYISVAALVNSKILCVHGGIGPDFTKLDDLRKLPKPNPYQLYNWRALPAVHQALWGDPAETDTQTGYSNSPRGEGIYVFGADTVEKFCQENGLDSIVRGHQVVVEGYELFARGRLWTVFSATNYCGHIGNAGAFLQVDQDLVIWPRTIVPSSISSWLATQYRPPSPPRSSREVRTNFIMQKQSMD